MGSLTKKDGVCPVGEMVRGETTDIFVMVI